MPCGHLEVPHWNIDEQLKSSGSPKTSMQDVLHGEKGLPGGSVPNTSWLLATPYKRNDGSYSSSTPTFSQASCPKICHATPD